MRHRNSSLVVVPLLAAPMILLDVAASPAIAKHHHHHIAVLHHGLQRGIGRTGSDVVADPAATAPDAKRDWKGDGKGRTGQKTPSSPQANTNAGNPPTGPAHGEDRGDDHSGKSTDRRGKPDDHGGTDNQNGKSAGPKVNPIDASNTIVPRPRFVHRTNAHGWKGFEIAHRFRKSFGVPKIWTLKRTIFTKGKTFTRTRIIRNAIGQRLDQAGADRRGRVFKRGNPIALDGIRRSLSPVTGSRGVDSSLASDSHHKPLVPLVWSVGRPHDPLTNPMPYRTSIDGRGMIHLGTGTAAIGGGANLNSGVLSGSSFHPRPR